MTDFVFDPPLRLARDVAVRTLDDAAEFARTYVGPRLPHRRDRLVRRLEEILACFRGRWPDLKIAMAGFELGLVSA
jgi:hypothetical protein